MLARCLPILLAPNLVAGTPAQFEHIRELIQDQMAEHQMPSVAVAVALNGKILWEEAFGWADKEKQVAATPNTMYSLASVTKPFTATALMVLRQQGKISLDKPVNTYLGDAKVVARIGNADEATVRRVSNHSAGLPLHFQFFFEDEPSPKPSMDETIRRYANLVTPPGERFQYSNLGFAILGHVIARVSGKSYNDFMREQVFAPLGLTHTSVNVEPGLEKFEAIRYGSDGQPLPFYDFDHPGALGIYSSVHDVVRFSMFHLKDHLADQKAILTDSAIEEMHRSTVSTGGASGYGIGWPSDATSTGYRYLAHAGSMAGVGAALTIVPAKNVAVAVLMNSSAGNPNSLILEILKTLIPDFWEERLILNPTERFQPGKELVGRWTGTVHTYKTDIPLSLLIYDTGDIHARLGNELETLVNAPRFENGYLVGQMQGDVGTEDANRRPYFLLLSLRQRGNALNGAMTAVSKPGPRPGNALTHWVELKKAP